MDFLVSKRLAQTGGQEWMQLAEAILTRSFLYRISLIMAGVFGTIAFTFVPETFVSPPIRTWDSVMSLAAYCASS